MQPELAAHFVLGPNVRARRGIATDQNNSKSRRDALRFQFCNLRAKSDINFFSNPATVDQISHPSSLDESAALNQRHHQILQTQSLALEFLVGRCRSYLLWLTNNHPHLRKWSWNYETVPALSTPAA